MADTLVQLVVLQMVRSTRVDSLVWLLEAKNPMTISTVQYVAL